MSQNPRDPNDAASKAPASEDTIREADQADAAESDDGPMTEQDPSIKNH